MTPAPVVPAETDLATPSFRPVNFTLELISPENPPILGDEIPVRGTIEIQILDHAHFKLGTICTVQLLGEHQGRPIIVSDNLIRGLKLDGNSVHFTGKLRSPKHSGEYAVRVNLRGQIIEAVARIRVVEPD